MEAQDLRIGNYVLISYMRDNSKVWGPFRIMTEDIVSIQWHPNDYKPIPLTEQWLIDFGAEKKSSGYFLHKMKFDFNTNGVVRFHWSQKVTYINYVHEFQNIVYDLTGKQLTK